MLTPLFAADDFGVIVTLIVMAVSAIGWVFNMMSGKNQPGPPPMSKPRRERPKPEEVSIFLDDTSKSNRSGQKSRKKPAPPAPPRPVVAPVAKRPGSEIATRHLQTSDLGSGVTTHVSEAIGRRVEQNVQDHMQRRVDQSVSAHLGQFSAAPPVVKERGGAADEIVDMLKNPASIRQVMILNTLLSPPPGFRRKSGGGQAQQLR